MLNITQFLDIVIHGSPESTAKKSHKHKPNLWSPKKQNQNNESLSDTKLDYNKNFWCLSHWSESPSGLPQCYLGFLQVTFWWGCRSGSRQRVNVTPVLTMSRCHKRPFVRSNVWNLWIKRENRKLSVCYDFMLIYWNIFQHTFHWSLCSYLKAQAGPGLYVHFQCGGRQWTLNRVVSHFHCITESHNLVTRLNGAGLLDRRVHKCERRFY